ncbi:hypothetical protein G4B84_010492 [Aspergillus flavus NRRL3357]|nr:uncharacterized protein G4B84_010492 [Aspergillus flavus NRRL3357]QMW35001.1 hypothetical protein G4B84_010492 [Aspergillus flavus NRRL3357]
MASSLSRGRRRSRKTSQEERICSVCSQSFKKAEHLARHFRSHTKERPFMCQVCGKLYARQDTLLRHARSQHLGTQPHQHPVHGNSAPTSPPISDPVSHLATLERPATDQVCASIDSIIPAPEQVLHELQFSSLDHDSNTATTPSLVHYPQHVDYPPFSQLKWAVPGPGPTIWNGQWEEDFPSLLPWESFDLDAVNQTLLESMDHGLHNTAPDPIENSLPLDPNLNLANGLTLRPKDLVGTEVFHGYIEAWARKMKLFLFERTPIGDIETLEDDSEALNVAWKSCVRLEERKRYGFGTSPTECFAATDNQHLHSIILAVHIHDSELAKLHYHEPILRHSPEKLPQIPAPELFAASNPKSWKALFTKHQQSTQGISLFPEHRSYLSHKIPENDFPSYTTLESIGASAYKNREIGSSWHAIRQKCDGLLLDWYHNYARASSINDKPDDFCLIILWHSIFMHLYTRFDELECSCGRDGEDAAQKARSYATSWATSGDATRTPLKSNGTDFGHVYLF